MKIKQNLTEKLAHPRGWDPEALKKMDIVVWSYLEDYNINRREILEAVDKVFSSGTLILGPHVKEFEQKFSNYCGAKYGVGVGSCTDGIIIGLKAMGIGNGDEVITVANTAVPTVAGITATGAMTRFVDIDPETHLMDTSKLENIITGKTKCIVPVHLYGQCVDMDKVNEIAKKHDLKVLEDCAQAHGATYKGKKAGSFGDLSTFSFYPTKVLGAFGDGGMIITSNNSLYERAKSLRIYGMKEKYFSLEPGYNSRLDEVQAAILLKKFTKLEKSIEKRNGLAKEYDRLLRDTPLGLPKTAEQNDRHIYYVYVVTHPKRDNIISKLKERGIFVNISYEWPIHLMDAFKYLGYKKGDLPNTERSCSEVLSLPMYPELTYEKVRKVNYALHDILEKI